MPPSHTDSRRIRHARLKVRNGLDILHVPYQGTAPQLVGLASGQVAAAILPMQITDGYVKDGKIRMIGLGSAERFSELPGLPTLIEQGMDVDFRSSVGFLGPAGIPADILNKLNQEIRATINEPGVRKNLLAQYVLPQDMSAQAYRDRRTGAASQSAQFPVSRRTRQHLAVLVHRARTAQPRIPA